MALHNLKITVVDGGKEYGGPRQTAGDNTMGGTGKNKQKSTLYKVLNYNQTIKNKVQSVVSPTTFFAIQSGINLATQTGRQFINYYVSDIGRRTGDSNYQGMVNRRIEQVTDAMSIAGGALSGAASGSIIPGIGTAVGAVVGAASSIISIGFRQAERNRAYQHEMFKESTSQAYNLSRADFNRLTGRLR